MYKYINFLPDEEFPGHNLREESETQGWMEKGLTKCFQPEMDHRPDEWGHDDLHHGEPPAQWFFQQSAIGSDFSCSKQIYNLN